MLRFCLSIEAQNIQLYFLIGNLQRLKKDKKGKFQ
jgi:hypothetical protein